MKSPEQLPPLTKPQLLGHLIEVGTFRDGCLEVDARDIFDLSFNESLIFFDNFGRKQDDWLYRRVRFLDIHESVAEPEAVLA